MTAFEILQVIFAAPVLSCILMEPGILPESTKDLRQGLMTDVYRWC